MDIDNLKIFSEDWYTYNADQIDDWSIHYDQIKDFSKEFFDSFHYDIDKNKMLRWACSNSYTKTIKMLIKNYGADVNSKGSDGYTSLHYACWDGDLKTVNILLEKFNADVNAKSINGFVALHYACSKGRIDIVKSLINNGAKIDVKDSVGCAPIHWACWSGHKDIELLLRKHS